MFVSLPEYLNGNWMDSELKELFGYMSLLLAIPVFFYSGQEYLISAWKGIRQRYINIDVPVALGLLVLFIRSSYEIISQTGTGYFDSLSGLVFFLLLGKFFQKKTYDSLSFERDYKSYFPVAVTKLNGELEENVAVKDLEKGDRILIRNEELIPADSILIRGKATIDNSFVTGESRPIEKHSGDRIYAGGRQMGEAIELEVIKAVSNLRKQGVPLELNLVGSIIFEPSGKKMFETIALASKGTDIILPKTSALFTPDGYEITAQIAESMGVEGVQNATFNSRLNKAAKLNGLN
mgnify:CR=1 FL=1